VANRADKFQKGIIRVFGEPWVNPNQIGVHPVDNLGNPGAWTFSPLFTTNAKTTKYYGFNPQSIAVRTADVQNPAQNVLVYTQTDQVNSTSLVTGQSGVLVAKTTYTPFGSPYQLEGKPQHRQDLHRSAG